MATLHHNQQIGQQGEEAACLWLSHQGYHHQARNYRAGRYGEIDLVTFYPESGILTFVEVKTRHPTHVATGLEALSAGKAQKLLTAIETYLTDDSHPKPEGIKGWQVDWVLVTYLPQLPWQHWPVSLIENVLWAD
jgi:putative endonuclease